MKRNLLHLVAPGVLLTASLVNVHVVVTPFVVAEIKAMFTSLFAASQTGDVQNIKRHLSDDEYALNKVLFEQNQDYPRFLRVTTHSVMNEADRGAIPGIRHL